MPRILVTHNNDLLVNFYSLEAVAQLRDLAEVTLNGTDEPLQGERLIAAAKDCDIVISDRLAPGTAEVFAGLPKLVAYLRCAVDARNIDAAAASSHGVLAVRCSQGYAEAVAEVAIGMMIVLARRMHIGDRFYKAGRDRQPMVMTRQLAGAPVGIIGYGAIGRRIADLCIALGMEVSVYDPYVRIANGNVRQVDLDRVLSHPLFVVFAAYATPETKEMMSRAAFRRMRRDAYFVNIARGNVVDEEALYEALIQGIIAGAGLDVGQGHDEQPSLRIAALPNVYAVPHVAGLTREASDHQAFETVKQVKEILAGKAPALALNPESWTRRRLLNARG
jgi:D-3-phosphoglycerate dehydrogenase